ncbi:MAG TPA: hypothetical protein VNR87_08825, partial [Flavisolibacter sp.]|nr:hypothetical protein [Flavisolibacter sp.]
ERMVNSGLNCRPDIKNFSVTSLPEKTKEEIQKEKEDYEKWLEAGMPLQKDIIAPSPARFKKTKR